MRLPSLRRATTSGRGQGQQYWYLLLQGEINLQRLSGFFDLIATGGPFAGCSQRILGAASFGPEIGRGVDAKGISARGPYILCVYLLRTVPSKGI